MFNQLVLTVANNFNCIKRLGNTTCLSDDDRKNKVNNDKHGGNVKARKISKVIIKNALRMHFSFLETFPIKKLLAKEKLQFLSFFKYLDCMS